MRILLKLTLNCDADSAWRAVHSPRAAGELYGPFVDLQPLVEGALPTSFTAGDDAPVRMSLGGGIPLGDQLIHVSERHVRDQDGPVRIFRDSGIPLTGPLASLDVWDHQMAIAPAPGDPDRTLWRERLVIGGPTAALLWPVLWSVWQWRRRRLRHLARTWAFDPEPESASRPDDRDS